MIHMAGEIEGRLPAPVGSLAFRVDPYRAVRAEFAAEPTVTRLRELHPEAEDVTDDLRLVGDDPILHLLDGGVIFAFGARGGDQRNRFRIRGEEVHYTSWWASLHHALKVVRDFQRARRADWGRGKP
jgi:hypothetical protein